MLEELERRKTEKSDRILYIIPDFGYKYRLKRILNKNKYIVIADNDRIWDNLKGLTFKDYKFLNDEDVMNILNGGGKMTEVPKWLYEVMKENGDLDENDMYHGIKVIPYTPIPEGFEIESKGE